LLFCPKGILYKTVFFLLSQPRLEEAISMCAKRLPAGIRAGRVAAIPQGQDTIGYLEGTDGIEYLFFEEDGRELNWGPDGPSFADSPAAPVQLSLKQPVLFTLRDGSDVAAQWSVFDPKSPEAAAYEELARMTTAEKRSASS